MDDSDSFIKINYQDLTLDLNLDKATSDVAWSNYESIRVIYTLEGEQLPWLACALYTACRRRSIPTVGGQAGVMSQGNYVSLTRMLQFCKLPLTEFILKMKLWLAMSHCEESFCRRVELLERNFAVSNNIFKKYKPIFLDIFKDPADDAPRLQRSRKQKRPLCNATELFQFCWTLYTHNKGKYPSIPQDLVSCYSLLLAAIDLMYANVVLSNRRDLLNPSCSGLPEGYLDSKNSSDLDSWSPSIVDYLCNKFDGVSVETKVVQEYYWKPNIKDLIEKRILHGTSDGMELLEQSNFDHNVKEIKNAYEEHLLSCGEFDERMFLNEESVMTRITASSNSPLRDQLNPSALNMNSAEESPKHSPVFNQRFLARCNLSQTFAGDHHLIPHTPITGRRYTLNRPKIGTTPITVITSGLQKLYSLIDGRSPEPSEDLRTIFSSLPTNPEESINRLIEEMSERFTTVYSQKTEDYSTPSPEFTKMRLKMGQILFYTFLEHILKDEKKRDVDLMSILKEELFHKTLFCSSLEIVLKSYNDARRFPWSLQVGAVHPYYFIRIIEPVIRSEKQTEAQLSRELVKHLKGIEEQILDSLAWRSESPLWEILKPGSKSAPSCEDVNFSHQLETSCENLALNSNSLMSPAIKLGGDPQKSPVTSFLDGTGSPIGSVTARRMLFSSSSSKPPVQSDILKRMLPPSLNGQSIRIDLNQPSTSNSSTSSSVGIERSGSTSTKSLSKESPSLPSPVAFIKKEDEVTLEKKDAKPRRHGSVALFFRKFYTVANMRLRDMCDRLEISGPDLRQKIWTCFEHSIIHYTDLMKDRHLDQMIMCAIYIICKVTANERIFQEIMKHYRNQPQASSHVYRSVLISSTENTSEGREGEDNYENQDRGDLIKFYNQIYVKNLKAFAQKFRPAATTDDVPKLSPLPRTRLTPVSPRRRISMNHPVYINSLSPLQASTTGSSPRKPLPYFFNRSPAKNLRVINNMVKHQNIGGLGGSKRIVDDSHSNEPKVARVNSMCNLGNFKKRFGGILGERVTSFPTSTANGNNQSSGEDSNVEGGNCPVGISPLQRTVVNDVDSASAEKMQENVQSSVDKLGEVNSITHLINGGRLLPRQNDNNYDKIEQNNALSSL